MAMAILGLLTTVALAVFWMGAHSLVHSDAQSELLQGAQVSMDQLTRDLERSTYASLSLTPGQGLGCLSAINSTTGIFDFDASSGRPRWRDYVLYYGDPVNKELRRATVAVTGTPQEQNPTPIEQFGALTPLTSYFVGGKLITQNLSIFSIVVDAQQVVQLEITLQRPHTGSTVPARYQLQTQVHLRN